MTIHTLAADIADRIPEMARDSKQNNAEMIETLLLEFQRQSHKQANEIETNAARLRIAMEALEDIGEIPRSGRAGRLAKAVLSFLQQVKPVSFEIGFITPDASAKRQPS